MSLCFATAFSSYAAIASASDVLSSPASASEAAPMLLGDDADYGIMPLSSVGSVTNTVDRTGVAVIFHSEGWKNHKNWYIESSGSIPRVQTDFNYKFIDFKLSPTALPPSGTYKFSFDMSSDISFDITKVQLISTNTPDNASLDQNVLDVTDYAWSSGDVYFYPRSISVNKNSSLLLRIYVRGESLTNFSGSARFRFSKTSDSPVFSSVGPTSAELDADYKSGVTSGLSNIGDTLEEIVETISMQLDALWNQLYNFMHLPQMAKLEEIRQAIENIRLDVDVDNQDVVNKLDQQIQNDNNNTQRVEEAVEKHGNFIIEGLKSLFIPDEEYFSSLFDRLHQFFSDRLGFLYVPFDLLIELMEAIRNADTAFAGIPFPGIRAGEWVLLEPTTVTFDVLNEFPELVTAMHFITSTVMIGAFLSLLHRKIEEVQSR